MSRLLMTCALLLVTHLTLAAPPTPGAPLPGFVLNDQHDKPRAVDAEVRVLLFSRDMGANKLAKAAFLDRPGDFLPTHHAVYAIDLSGMPGFVTNTFAVPKMRGYAYPIALDREGKLTADLPNRKGEVTVIVLDHLQVKSVAYATTAAALVAAVDQAAAR